MKIENIAGIEVNVDEALQALLGETKIEQEDGYFVLNFNDEGEWLQVTVYYERTEADTAKGFVPNGVNSVFNESYSFDTFSFEQLIEDLHAQQLEDVENWLYSFLENPKGEIQMKAIVIINENHSLFPEQEAILRERFKEIEFVKVPAAGWTLDEMRKIAYDLHNKIPWDGPFGSAIVFASPIPYLLRELTQMAIWADVDDDIYTYNQYDVLVFHNDQRDKKELPDGRIIQTVAREGWQLV